MELEPRVMKDHCGHHTDAETGCPFIWVVMWCEPSCPGGQGNNWEEQARGILCQRKWKAFRTEGAQKSLGAVLTSALIRIVRPAGRALQGQKMKINPREDNREIWIHTTWWSTIRDQGTYGIPNNWNNYVSLALSVVLNLDPPPFIPVSSLTPAPCFLVPPLPPSFPFPFVPPPSLVFLFPVPSPFSSDLRSNFSQ